MVVLEHVLKPHPACAANLWAATHRLGLKVAMATFRPPTRVSPTKVYLLGSGTRVSKYTLRAGQVVDALAVLFAVVDFKVKRR